MLRLTLHGRQPHSLRSLPTDCFALLQPLHHRQMHVHPSSSAPQAGSCTPSHAGRQESSILFVSNARIPRQDCETRLVSPYDHISHLLTSFGWKRRSADCILVSHASSLVYPECEVRLQHCVLTLKNLRFDWSRSHAKYMHLRGLESKQSLVFCSRAFGRHSCEHPCRAFERKTS